MISLPTYPVVQVVSYCLIHAPSLVRLGTTCQLEGDRNPDSPWLKRIPAHLRSYEQALAYPPHQCFIGNLNPWDLGAVPRPWHAAPGPGRRFGPYGEIMPEDEFYGAVALADSFNLVVLEADFTARVREKLAAHPCYGPAEASQLKAGADLADVERFVAGGAVPLHHGTRMVGCVRAAHEVDESLSAHIMLENLITKASGALALKHLLRSGGVAPAAVDYLLECSEEACGDMNQRGGGNFAKAVGELAGCSAATGSDVRAFCAAPAHALVQASALIQSGVYTNVAVLAGGSLAKLGMNSREHINKELPVLEDVIGAFSVLVSPDDGVSPRLRTDLVGRHTIGAGAAPQAVMQALVVEPLERAGLKVTDVDIYAAELQNPEITEPAGAGDVPRANLRMIGALGVRRGDLVREELEPFVNRHGVPGFAPTQGHIPSGIPFVGHARDAIRSGRIRRAMIVGKGSLFLGRMTNLFDGVSLLLDQNPGKEQQETAAPVTAPRRLVVGLTVPGSELGDAEVVRGAVAAQRVRPDLEIVLIGGSEAAGLRHIIAAGEAEAHQVMERMLTSGELNAAVTMHFNFPLGVASVGRVVTPGRGKEMLLATVTGAAAADRVEAMVRSAIYGQAVARALGVENPELGVLNLDGGAAALRVLRQLADRGYRLRFADSGRADAGALMRGNDVLTGAPDLLVTDTLTGNVLMKVLSAFTTGGNCESTGYGYGPGVGPGFAKVVGIISRASGAPVIANALGYAGDMARANLPRLVAEQWQRAEAAGLGELLGSIKASPVREAGAVAPKPVSKEIAGIDVLELEDAVAALGAKGLYAAAGMGCTGPVLLVAPEDESDARSALITAGFLR